MDSILESNFYSGIKVKKLDDNSYWQGTIIYLKINIDKDVNTKLIFGDNYDKYSPILEELEGIDGMFI